MHRGTTPRLLLTCALALAAWLLVPAAASANVQVAVNGWDFPEDFDPPTGVIIVQGTNATNDEATVTFVPNGLGTADDTLEITSTSAPLSDNDGPGAGACNFDLTGTKIVCDLNHPDATDRTVVLSGESGDDRLTYAGPASPLMSVTLIGGIGNDVLTGGAGTERFYGDDGLGTADCLDSDNPTGLDPCDDEIHDGLGNDRVRAEGGDDQVIQSALGGASPDLDEDDITLGLGDGDSISYAARAASDAVTVRIGGTDGVDNTPGETLEGSGTPGEEDDVHSGVERVIGTAGNDTFRTTSSPISIAFEGGAGNDTFIAAPASETFIGGPGVDTVTWADVDFGFDGITATANGIADDGDDGESDDVRNDVERLIGTSGVDTMLGAPSAGCRISGGAGADSLTAPATGCILEGGNGADTIVGGAGDDTIRPGGSGIAAFDVVTFGGGTDTADYSTGSLVGTDSTVVGVLASASTGATVWCYGLGTGAASTSARKTVAGQQHLDRWMDAPETIVGTIVTDTLCGGSAGTRLEGGAGADTLVGGTGNDLILGGLGDDALNGQGGNDVLDGSDGADSLNGGAGADIVDGGPGDDPHVRGGGGSDTIRGGPGNDTLDEVPFSAVEQGKPEEELDAADVLEGGPGTDVLDGAGGDDVVTCTLENLADSWSDSGGGTETLDCSGLGVGINYAAGAGIDVLIGTAVDDVLSGATTIDGGAGNDTLTAAASGSTIRGGPGNDRLVGSDAKDVLGGGDGNDSISAGGGDDVVDGGFGGDTMDGGPGSELLSYESRGSGVNVTQDGIANDGTAGEGDNVTGFEELIGTASKDTLGAGSSATNLVGLGGDDVLVGSPAGELLQGGDGNDRLAAGGGANVLEGGAGDDTLIGGGNADKLDGGDGHDVLDGGAGTDVFVGGTGRDTVDYSSRSKPLVVTIGDSKANDGEKGENEDVPFDVENVYGGAGKDRLVGSGPGNSIRGGAGNDTILGSGGNDVLYGGPGNDAITGGKGNDKHYGEAGNDKIDSRDTVAKERKLKELVDGGAGVDTVQRDAADRIVRIERKAVAKRVVVRGKVVTRFVIQRIARFWRA